MRGVHGVRQQARSHDHEHEAGELEELGEVDLHATPVDQVADHDRHRDAEDRADPGRLRVLRVVEHRDEEHGGLEALADHREERHRHQRGRGTSGERGAGARVQVALQAGGVLAHPEDHPGDHAHRDQGHDRLELFLLLLGKLLRGDAQADAHADRDEHTEDDAGPHPLHGVAPPLLHEEGGDDAHDQGGLEAFSQSDDEGRQHGCPSTEDRCR